MSQEFYAKFLLTYKHLPMSDEAVEMSSLMVEYANEIRKALKSLTVN